MCEKGEGTCGNPGGAMLCGVARTGATRCGTFVWARHPGPPFDRPRHCDRGCCRRRGDCPCSRAPTLRFRQRSECFRRRRAAARKGRGSAGRGSCLALKERSIWTTCSSACFRERCTALRCRRGSNRALGGGRTSNHEIHESHRRRSYRPSAAGHRRAARARSASAIASPGRAWRQTRSRPACCYLSLPSRGRPQAPWRCSGGERSRRPRRTTLRPRRARSHRGKGNRQVPPAPGSSTSWQCAIL